MHETKLNERIGNIKIKVLNVCIIITWTWETPSTDTLSNAPFAGAILRSMAIFQAVDNRKENEKIRGLQPMVFMRD